jgi:hypothetical protein
VFELWCCLPGDVLEDSVFFTLVLKFSLMVCLFL